jgi:NAD/NADP transhydrogenase alpha subunit
MVGGFVVTDRMLQMFTRRRPAKAAVQEGQRVEREDGAA